MTAGAAVSRNIIRMGLLGVAAVTLSGCILFDGSHRTGPDEFGVVTRAPLSQPPDYALRPPRAGAQRPNEVSPREQARSELLKVSARSGDSRYALATNGQANGANGTNGAKGEADNSLSRGEEALLREADALGVDPDIRVTVDRESGRVTEDAGLVDKLVFWRGKDQPTAKAIDPKKEAERLNRNAALGVPPTATPPKER
jgi:hypothetical protein